MHAQPNFWNGLDSIYRTVAVVDLVGYSSLARMLEENMGAAAVAELNRRIQDLIQEALSPLPSCSYTLIAKTGDGALVLFEDAPCAHQFAVELHQCAARHNTARTDKSAQRSFRIGIASGEINVVAQEYAGITIANAVRLETAAKPGEILVDLATFDKLPPAEQQAYSGEAIVRGKRDEVFRVRKWTTSAHPSVHTITRRRAIAISLGATAGVGLGCWGLTSPRLINLLQPLPAQRFVAFAAWPEPAAEIAAVTREVVSSMKQSLQRMETFDHAFLVVDAEEPGETAPDPQKPTPIESAQKFGANLALLASSGVVDSRLHLTLKVVDTRTQDTLRQAKLSSSMKDLAGLREHVIRRVAALLDLPEHPEPIEDDQEIARMPPRAYQLFAEGKALVSDFNGAHRAAGVATLQELVNMYPTFSVSFGELAVAYVEDFRTSREPAMLDLAATNAKQALKLNPDSALALLANAKVETELGRADAALFYIRKLLAQDPRNADALFYRAKVYRAKGDFPGEMHAWQQILDSRPNYWRAYNEIGRAQSDRAKYAEAAQAFSMASHLAPSVSLPLTNLGTTYLFIGDRERAAAVFQHSITIYPTADAYTGLGTIAFAKRNYKRALDAYTQARSLEPRSHDILRDIGDCQTMLEQSEAAKTTFREAADILTEELMINPSSGANWMILSLYHAKVGAFVEASSDLDRARRRGASDIDSAFIEAQTLAVLNRNEESLQLVLKCLDKGLSPESVDLAVDLSKITKDSRYMKKVKTLQALTKS